MSKKWFIPDGFFHSRSNGVFPSHEAICILNVNKELITVNLTLFFEDRDKMTGFKCEVGSERTLHIRMDKIKNDMGEPVPCDTPYSIMIECEKDIYIQYTRVDTSQSEMAVATTIV